MSFYEIANFIVNEYTYRCCECDICNSIKNTGSNKCCDDEKNCVAGVADYLKEKFGGDESESAYISATEIARYLNTEATDEQFAEVFALLHRAMSGRNMSNVYDTKQIIEQMDVDVLMQCLGRTLKEIQAQMEEK